MRGASAPARAGVPGFAHADDPHNSLFGRTRNQSMFRELGLLPSLVGRGWGVLAGARAIAAAVAMVCVSFAAVAQVPSGAQLVPPSDQPGRERERFEPPAVPLAQPGGPTIAVPGIEAPPGAAETTLVIRQ